jgi:hypothetical protein
MNDPKHELTEETTEEFGELIRFTVAGFFGGLVAGAALDHFGFSRSGIGQWLVRTLSGEGESIFEGIFALRKRIVGAAATMAEAYGWGKLLGMAFPWVVDGASRLAGVDVYGLPGFYIPFFYAMSDQIGGNVSGLLFLRRHHRSWRQALRSYVTHPVMLAGLLVIFAVPAGLFIARMIGFSPSTQVLTAAETIVANLCWVPPLVGSLSERRSKREEQ